MSQGQKDFLAISHGQEWVSFYESFDKLVQDNLSRSSDLLRRAMSLPEVADREVEEVRTEMEEKIAAERSMQRELLSALQQDLTGSHRQVSMLARGVGAVIGDLERLSQRVNEAITAMEAEAEAEPAPPAAATAIPNGVPARTNGVATYSPPPQAPETPVFAPEEPVEAEVPVAAGAEIEPLSAAEVPSEISIDDITAAVEEQAAMLEAAENQLEDLETAIDLTALAEAEVATVEPDAGAQESQETALAGADAPAAGERPRPHWLSVTRAGSRT